MARKVGMCHRWIHTCLTIAVIMARDTLAVEKERDAVVLSSQVGCQVGLVRGVDGADRVEVLRGAALVIYRTRPADVEYFAVLL